jgi:hypothetical protein
MATSRGPGLSALSYALSLPPHQTSSSPGAAAVPSSSSGPVPGGSSFSTSDHSTAPRSESNAVSATRPMPSMSWSA